MEKLKIYSAYLPYNLIGTFNIKDVRPDLRLKENREKLLTTENTSFFIDYCKPILFSLEDLTREITIGGETFVPLHKILEEYCFNIKVMSKEEILSYQESLLEIDISYKVHSLLLEWKFNVFNLSETEYIKVTEENKH